MTRRERIRKVAREHPDMPLELLAERFGDTVPAIRHTIEGIRREPDFFSAYVNGRRKTG